MKKELKGLIPTDREKTIHNMYQSMTAKKVAENLDDDIDASTVSSIAHKYDKKKENAEDILSELKESEIYDLTDEGNSNSIKKDIKYIVESEFKRLLNILDCNGISKVVKGTNPRNYKSSTLGQKQERCTEENLVWPILETLGYEYMTEAYDQNENSYIDLQITNLNTELYGEVKPIGNYKDAMWDISSSTSTGIVNNPYGIYTDGISWGISYFKPDAKIDYTTIAEFSFSDYALKYYHEQNVDFRLPSNRDPDELPSYQDMIDKFISIFQPESVDENIENFDI